MPIKYYCSNGDRIAEGTIQSRYSKALREKYSGMPTPRCYGCGAPAAGNAHIIAKARLKVLHKTELIYDPRAFFPACQACNRAIENPKGSDWEKLFNVDECLNFIEKHDLELFSKFIRRNN